MHYKMFAAVGALALTLGAGACSRDTTVERRDAATANDAAREVDRAAELRQQRDQDLSKLDDRIASLERDYEGKRQVHPRGTSGTSATTGLRNDVKSDMDDVKKAVNDLRTTTPENWWDRHESVLKTAANDVESDVKRFAGTRTELPKNSRLADGSDQPASTAPFTSRRDEFVADMRTRVDAMETALANVKATGPRKTELDDLRARVNKLSEDIDRLKSASAEDWWDVSKARVNDYIDRVENSVARLDDHKQ